MVEFLPFIMFLTVCLVLMAGYPVALTLAGTSFLFALVGASFGFFDMAYLEAFPNRLFGIMENTTLIAVHVIYFYGRNARKIKVV